MIFGEGNLSISALAGAAVKLGATPGAIADLAVETVGLPGAEDLQFDTAGATNAVSYHFRYRVTGQTTWEIWRQVGTVFAGAQNTGHDFQIRGVSATGKVGPASNTAIATTPYNFPDQIGDLVLTVSATLPPTIALAYTAAEDAVTHEAQYRESGATDWISAGTITSSLVLPLNVVAYEVQVRGVNPGFTGDWSNLATVTTGTPTTFSDSFTQSNKNLSTAVGWAKFAGTDADVQIVSNSCNCGNSGGSNATVIACTNLYVRNAFAQFRSPTSSIARCHLFLKVATDFTGDHVRLRLGTAGVMEVTVRAAGTSTLRISVANTAATNDVYRLEYSNGVVTLKKNGVTQGSPYSLTPTELAAISVLTRTGLGNATNSLSNAADDFSHGAL